MSLGTAELYARGVIGNCLDLTYRESAPPNRVFISSSPSMDSVEGVAVECFIFLNDPGTRIILCKGDAYKMTINPDGLLTGSIRVKAYDQSGETVFSDVPLESASYFVPLKRGVRIGLQFNGYALYLTADGIIRNREQFKQKMILVPHAQRPFDIGPGELPFDGLFDELRLSAAVLGKEMPFRDTIQLIGKKIYSIHFDAKGFLDRDFHSAPAVVEFFHAMKTKYRITIGLMGEVR